MWSLNSGTISWFIKCANLDWFKSKLSSSLKFGLTQVKSLDEEEKDEDEDELLSLFIIY
jgi:hypothetical protein